jgi:hypothetical protein
LAIALGAGGENKHRDRQQGDTAPPAISGAMRAISKHESSSITAQYTALPVF